MQKFITFLMFNGQAEEAMNFYVSIFKHSKINNITRYKAREAGAAGTVMQATLSLNGQTFMCIDSPVQHGFTFTPAISIYINCESEPETEELFNKLSADGNILMPLDTYPFSKKYAWLTDKFGIAWQLSFNK
jgi:predicted 3-demethylubiquinone-9 3-methyltransferase (glyoxalase superfamily)